MQLEVADANADALAVSAVRKPRLLGVGFERNSSKSTVAASVRQNFMGPIGFFGEGERGANSD